MIKKISDSHPNIFIENEKIKQVYECKTLGVTIDQHLSWKSNTENICKKITAGISAIRRVKPFVDIETLVSIYNAIVRPYFDYCCVGMCLVKHNQKDFKNCKIELLDLS